MTNLPVTGAFSITAIYGQKGKNWANGHKGLDFTATDKRVFATCDGVVRKVAYDAKGWGWYVSVGESNGRRHVFCHLSAGSIKVKQGQKVNRLTVLGTMGDTGNATGVHLHYQLQNGEKVINPCEYLGLPNKVGKYNSKNFDNQYKDAKSIPSWATDAVKYVTEKGYMQGDDLGNFNPNQSITRAELAVVLQRLDK